MSVFHSDGRTRRSALTLFMLTFMLFRLRRRMIDRMVFFWMGCREYTTRQVATCAYLTLVLVAVWCLNAWLMVDLFTHFR